MDDTLNESLNTILLKAIEGIDSATSFLSAEIPEVVQQILTWNMYYHSFTAIVGVLILFTCVLLDSLLGRHIYRRRLSDTESNIDWDSVLMLYGLGGMLIRAVYLAFSVSLLNLQWLKIMVAPKLWLIEYASNLVK